MLGKILLGFICISFLQSCGSGIFGGTENQHPSQRIPIKDENVADEEEVIERNVVENTTTATTSTSESITQIQFTVLEADESFTPLIQPKILRVTPPNNNKNVDASLREISVEFDKPMLISSINFNTFQILRSDQTKINGSISYDESNNVASIYFDENLLANANYTIIVSSEIKNIYGVPIEKEMISRFSTILPKISAIDIGVSEAVGTAQIEVMVNSASAVEFSVDYSTQDVSAISSNDFEANNGTLLFAVGETKKTIPVSIIDNVVINDDVQFQINLSNATNAVISDKLGLVTILNDDALIAPQLSLKNGDEQVTLSWPAVVDASSYNIYYATSSGVTADNYVDLNGVALVDASNGTTISGLTNGVDYYFVVTTLTGSTESVASSQTASRPRTTESIQPTLNDTGIINGGLYPNGNFLDCNGETIEEQDCSYGRDFTKNDNADGHGGFSYTKLDANNNELATNGSAWSCVKDNVTGLIWEVKTVDGQRRDASYTYAWYNSTGVNDNGFGSWGDQDYGTCFDTGMCNSETYTNKVNTAGLCGFNDWRLPSKAELRSLVNLGAADPSIDTNYFPNTTTGSYWTSSPIASTSTAITGDIWVIRFSNGSTSRIRMDFSGKIRLVRGG